MLSFKRSIQLLWKVLEYSPNKFSVFKEVQTKLYWQQVTEAYSGCNHKGIVNVIYNASKFHIKEIIFMEQVCRWSFSIFCLQTYCNWYLSKNVFQIACTWFVGGYLMGQHAVDLCPGFHRYFMHLMAFMMIERNQRCLGLDVLCWEMM